MSKVYIEFEEDDWDLFRDLLLTQAESGALSEELRKDLEKAIDRYEYIEPRILLEIRGGVLQNVTATMPMDVYILDYDKLEEADQEDIREAYLPTQPYSIVTEDDLEMLVKENLADFDEGDTNE